MKSDAARKFRVTSTPEKTEDYRCLNRECERFERVTPVLVPPGMDQPKHHRGSHGARVDSLQLFAPPERERVDDGLACYACGSPLSRA